MMTLRPSKERGHAEHGWLDTYHTFSFADYHDPQHMGFRSLRVINEDRVAPGEGFGTHPHADMEILTYVLEGALEHKDSMGHREQLRAGEFQAMTAGTGITHSEYNASQSDEVHLVQIWIKPERKGLTPSYAQRAIKPEEKSGTLRLVASREPGEGVLKINQDARVYLGALDKGGTIHHELPPSRHAWLQVLRGDVTLNGAPLKSGDGARLSDEQKLEIKATNNAEILLFDLA